MGTRCHIVVLDYYKRPCCCIHTQYDGYPEGHGQELCDLLEDRRIVNGFRMDDDNVANGTSDLAAQVVAHLKARSKIGGIYLYAPPAVDNSQSVSAIAEAVAVNAGSNDAEYAYVLYGGREHIGKDRRWQEINISAWECNAKPNCIYEGPIAGMMDALEKERGKPGF